MVIATIFLSLLALPLLYLLHILVSLWDHKKKLDLIPSKKPHPIFGHCKVFMVPRNRLVHNMTQLIKENQSLFIVWLGPLPVLTVYEPKHIEVILGSTKYINKPFQYGFLEPWLGTGLLTSGGKKWRSHRKMLTPSFHFKVLENLIPVFAEKSKILVNKLANDIGSDSVNMFQYIALCALDIICETAMGTEINAQVQEQHSDYVKAVIEISDNMTTRLYSPWLIPDFIYNLTSLGRSTKKCIKILHAFTNKVICERKAQYMLKKAEESANENDTGIKQKLTFLDLLLESSENGNKLTDEEIREEVDTFMFEGHDTTTAGISWALQMLASHPDVQEKVFEELDAIFEGSDRCPTMKDLNEMKYLERVIKESLRLYPSVPMIGRDLKEDVIIDGFKIPAPMQVAIHIYHTHRIPENYPDPLKFNPDNFLPERIAARHPYAYVPFSAGPRNCIGQKFAILEEKTVISYVLRHYRLEATGEVPIALPELILRPENGIHLKIIPRKNETQIP